MRLEAASESSDGKMAQGQHAARSLARAPDFSVIVVATLALAIGANTAIFSVVNVVLLRPLPFPNADRLVHIEA